MQSNLKAFHIIIPLGFICNGGDNVILGETMLIYNEYDKEVNKKNFFQAKCYRHNAENQQNRSCFTKPAPEVSYFKHE